MANYDTEATKPFSNNNNDQNVINELVSLIDDDILMAAASMTPEQARKNCDEIIRTSFASR